MQDLATTKICRKSAEGYSEIIDNVSSADLDKAMYDYIYKKKSRIEYKWVILLLGLVVIIGGLCCITYTIYIMDNTVRPCGISEHESCTSTRNSGNLTNSNINFYASCNKLFEQFGHLYSAFGEFLKAFRKFYFSNSDSQPVHRDDELQTKATTLYDENTKINNSQSELLHPQLESNSNYTSESMPSHKRKKRNISNGTEIEYRFSKLYPYFSDLYTQYEKFNSSFDAFMRAFKKYFSGNLQPVSNPKERRDTELQSGVTTIDENITSANPNTSTVVTDLGMSKKNAGESEIDTSAAESYTNEQTIPDRNSNSSVPESYLTKASMLDTGTPPVPTTMVTDTERQNQSKNHLSNRDVTTSLYSKNTVNQDILSNGEKAVGDDTATNSIIDEISSTESTADIKKTENPDILDTPIWDKMEESPNIMKIPPKVHTTAEPPTHSNFEYTTLESIYVNEVDMEEKNNQSIAEIGKIIEQNTQANDISSKIKDSLFNTLGRTSDKKRLFRNVHHSENPWKLYCFRMVLNSEGKMETRIVNVPINESDVENMPHIKFRKSDHLPPYSAHSLETHKLYAEYSKDKNISNNTTEFFDKSYNSSEVFSFPGHELGEGSHYCTYSKSFRNTEDEKNDEFESEIKSLLTEQISLKELERVLCNSNERICANERQCVKSSDWCNGIINCHDRSDEMNCSCKERTYVSKICDGYFDCPNGEDESGCFGCSENEFSCDDWETWRPNATCVSMSQRCDGFPNCMNGKDEMDCELLADKIFSHDTFLVSYTSGYLHRNWKGKWYPVCVDENSESSKKACENELGVKNLRKIEVNMKPISGSYNGQFITMTKDHFLLTDQCMMVNSAVYVDCPVECCGTRRGYNNNKLQYRYKRDLNNDKGKATSNEFVEALVRQLVLDKNTQNEFNYKYKTNLTNKVTTDLYTSNKRKRREETEERVVGGKTSGPGFWPWVVALYKNGVFHCGGVILNEKWIMTAAHCVQEYRNNYFEVQAGILRRLSFSPMEQNRPVSHVIIHTQYSRSDMKNDIALLLMDPPLKLNRWIRAICLPESRPPWGPAPGTKCTAVGWGATREHGPDPDNMREVEVPILSMCKHEADREGEEICAGYMAGGHDTCQGDSGGPLLCPISHNKDHWFVGGIVSHGEGCARPLEPGAYTRIALYLPWLVKNADDKHLSDDLRTVLHCPGMKCPDGGRCIAKKKICDNVIDCLNGEDEANCHRLPSKNLEVRSSETIPKHPTDEKYEENEPPFHGLDDLMNSIQNLTMKSNEKKESPFHSSDDLIKSTQNPRMKSIIIHNRTSDNEFGHTNNFTCKIIEQILPKVCQCDGQVDCEDGTDEMNCTCANLLRSVDQSLLCNHIVDCDDLTDEINYCSQRNCTINQFLCYKSKTCINKTQQCDGKIDCANGEDEENCYALAGNDMSFDFFKVPTFSIKGYVMKNENGTWKFFCTSEISRKKSEEICHNLGFKAADTFEKVKIFGTCSDYGIEMNCTSHQNDSEILPWHANIYINGEKRCIGLLLNRQWIIANPNCHYHYNSQNDHIVAVLGGRRKIENLTRSPDEQVIVVDYMNFIEKKYHNITMIHLERSTNDSKFVRPLRPRAVSLWTPPPKPDSRCLLIAGLHEPFVIDLNADKNCTMHYCYFEPKNKTTLCTYHKRNFIFSGIICETKVGQWHLTAVLDKELVSFCSSNGTKFQLEMWDDPKPLYSPIEPFLSSNCSEGYRCKLGKCIRWSQVCDGKPDCRNSEDEAPERCSSLRTYCYHNQFECPCKTYEFKCKNNGKCIDKNLICNDIKDCKDGSDEPAECASFSCATYLNMTNPQKLCDGHIDCGDKSDESLLNCPSFCNTKSHFKCVNSTQCIPLEFVCDGERDCTAGEDENDCRKLQNHITNENQPTLFRRWRGKWQAGWALSDFTDFNPEVICQMNKFAKVTKLKLIPGIKTPSAEYRKIKLGNGKEFELEGKPLTYSNSTEDYTYVHLNCE